MYEVEKVWEYKGNTCVVIMTDMGHRCGYVGIPPGHFLYGQEHNDKLPDELKDKLKEVLEGPIGKRGLIDVFCFNKDNPELGILFDVHGGVTFSGGDGKYPIEKDNIWWFGYDCAHADDARDLSKVSDRVRELELTFPTRGVIRTLDYCISECESLSDQLEELK